MTASREPETIPAGFRARLRQHNREAAGWALLCGSGAMLLWSAAYGVLYWMVLLAATVWVGPETELPVRGFSHAFAAGVVSSLVAAVLLRGSPWVSAGGFWRRGLVEILLAPARLTWSALANLRAICRLDRLELAAAWRVASELWRAGQLDVAALPALEPDDRARERAVLALQLAGLVVLRPGPQGWVALLADEAVREVCAPRQRLRPPDSAG